MKNIILDTARGIEGFTNVEELIEAINYKSAFIKLEEKQIFEGFMLILWELEDDITLQRNTFYQTMLNVKNQFAVRNRHRHTAIQMNVITLSL